MPQKKKKKPDETPLSTRLLMAVIGIVILAVLYYCFASARFPTEISFENLR